MSGVKKSVICSLCIAMCVVLPLSLHSFPEAGKVLCPIHIPVLLCGLICGAGYGLFCGLTGPLLSAFVTGMPNMASLPAMTVECAVYGLVAGLMIRLLRDKKSYMSIMLSLIAAMLAGRLVGGAARALIFAVGEYSLEIWLTGYFIKSFPAIIVQLLLIPPVVAVLRKAGLAGDKPEVDKQSTP